MKAVRASFALLQKPDHTTVKKVFYRILFYSDGSSIAESCYQSIAQQLGCQVQRLPQKKGPFLAVKQHLMHQHRMKNYDLIILPETVVRNSLIQAFKKINPLTSLLVLAPQPTVKKAVAAIRGGVDDYLGYPLTVPLFKSAVGQILEKKNLLSRISSNTDVSYIQKLAYFDEVTHLYNLRYLNHFLELKLIQAQLNTEHFAVLFVDVDHFKAVNDRYGHRYGTQLLYEVSQVLKRLIRDHDKLFRYGGDEFVAVLSDCNLSIAQRVAERIRSHIENHVFLEKERLKVHVTVSIGVALFPHHATHRYGILEAADQAMYQAKRTIKNCIVVSQARGKKKGWKNQLS